MAKTNKPQKIGDVLPEVMAQVNQQQAKNSKTGRLFARIPRPFIDSGHWARLSPAARSLLVVLSAHAHVKTKTFYICRDLFMRESGIKKPHTFAKALKELEHNPACIATWLQNVKRPRKRYHILI